MNKITPHTEEKAIAKENPNGWVYRISGEYEQDERIPPEAIVGAWKVDCDGCIEGEFIPNPNFKNNDERK